MTTSQEKVEIPPGLTKYVRKKRRKPSKKFILISTLSLVLILLGYALVFLLPIFSTKKTQESRISPDVVIHYRIDNSTGVPEMRKEIVPIKPPESVKEPALSVAESKPKPEQKPEPKTEAQPTKRDAVESKESAKQTLQEPKQPMEQSEPPPESFKGADFLYRASDYEKKGLLTEAIKELKGFINYTNSADPKILNKISALYLKLGNLQEAEHYSELAMKSPEKSREILINYGVIKAKLGNLDKAEEVFDAVLKREPQNKTALHNLALIKERKGKIEEAISLFERLHRLGDRDALHHLERLKRQS